VLSQYIDALAEAYSSLEKMYAEKNIAGFEKVKSFMIEASSKINLLLEQK